MKECSRSFVRLAEIDSIAEKQDSGHFFSLRLDQLPESRDAMDGQSMVTKKEKDFFRRC